MKLFNPKKSSSGNARNSGTQSPRRTEQHAILRTGSASPRTLVLDLTVTDRVRVPSAFYASIKAKIEEEIAHLHNFDYLVPQDLLGPDVWCGFSQAEKKMAGICIAHLSQTGALPITALAFDIDYPEFYVLRGARLQLN